MVIDVAIGMDGEIVGDELSSVVLIGMGFQGRGYMTAAHRLGLSVSLLDHSANLGSPDVREMLKPGDRVYEVPDSASLDEWLVAAGSAIADVKPAGIIAFSEQHVMPAALLAAELGLPSPGLRASMISRNKFLQREMCSRALLSGPKYILATNIDIATDWSIGKYPVVLKPLSAAGSQGVKIVANEEELLKWVQGEFQDSFLCEEFIDGPEYSCELLLVGGVRQFANVTSKVTTQPPFCVEVGHFVPARCDPGTADLIIEFAMSVVVAAGMQTGLAHVEVRVAAGQAFLMEFAVRTPGGFIMDAIELATGVNLFSAVVEANIGRPVAIEPNSCGAACVWYPVPKRGMAEESFRSASDLPGVVRVDVIGTSRDTLTESWRNSSDRVGSVILLCGNNEDLDQCLLNVRSAVESPDPIDHK